MMDVLSGAVIADLALQATRTVAESAGLTMVGVDDRLAALGRLSRDAFEAGLYERNVFPEGGVDD
jgi:hypothetical protein